MSRRRTPTSCSSSIRPPVATRARASCASPPPRVPFARSAIYDQFAPSRSTSLPPSSTRRNAACARHRVGHREGPREAQRSSHRRRDRSRCDVRARARTPPRQGAGGGRLRRRRRADLRRDRLRRPARSPSSVADRVAHAFFAIGTGADAHHELLAQLARAGGGQYCAWTSQQTTSQALRLTSAIKTAPSRTSPSTSARGSRSAFYSATASYRAAKSLFLLARTHHPLPRQGRRARAHRGQGLRREARRQGRHDVGDRVFVPRLWAVEYARRLMGSGTSAEDNRAQILQLGRVRADHAIHELPRARQVALQH